MVFLAAQVLPSVGMFSNKNNRMFSSTFLDKNEVTERVLSVLKKFDKVHTVTCVLAFTLAHSHYLRDVNAT